MRIILKKYVDKFVCCETEEDVNSFLLMAHNQGYLLANGEKIINNNSVFREPKTCYLIYADKKIADYKPITAATFFYPIISYTELIPSKKELNDRYLELLSDIIGIELTPYKMFKMKNSHWVFRTTDELNIECFDYEKNEWSTYNIDLTRAFFEGNNEYICGVNDYIFEEFCEVCLSEEENKENNI